MHFVSGGAYNGKANWVKQQYNLKLLKENQYNWISAYREERLPETLSHIKQDIVILEGMERWIYDIIIGRNPDIMKNRLQEIISEWHKWEQQNKKQLIIIGTDIFKGIVPLEEQNRNWRDVTGFVYQYIVEKSSQFTYVWYGIGKSLK